MWLWIRLWAYCIAIVPSSCTFVGLMTSILWVLTLFFVCANIILVWDCCRLRDTTLVHHVFVPPFHRFMFSHRGIVPSIALPLFIWNKVAFFLHTLLELQETLFDGLYDPWAFNLLHQFALVLLSLGYSFPLSCSQWQCFNHRPISLLFGKAFISNIFRKCAFCLQHLQQPPTSCRRSTCRAKELERDHYLCAIGGCFSAWAHIN